MSSEHCAPSRVPRTVLAPCYLKKIRMNYICTVSSEQRIEDRAATLLPEERASNVSVLCLHSCAPGHVSRTGLSPCYQKKARLMYLYYVFRALCRRPRVEDRAVALLPEESAQRISVVCLQSAVPQATCRGQGCRRATSAPTGPTSRTRGRRCASNVPTRPTQSSEPRPPSLSAWVGAGLLSPFCFLHWVVTFKRK